MHGRTRGQARRGRFWRWLFRRAKTVSAHGVTVGAVWTFQDEREQLFGKVRDAVDLLHRHAPRTLARLRADVDGILLFSTQDDALAIWSRAAELVILRDEWVADPSTSAAEVSSALVHEATHARLDRLGVPYTADRRAQIEGICFRRELAFARRLPEPAELVERAQLQLARDPTYWTDEAFRQRAVDGLRAVGLSGWLVRLLERISRRYATQTTRCSGRGQQA